jgi:hypothetical protein
MVQEFESEQQAQVFDLCKFELMEQRMDCDFIIELVQVFVYTEMVMFDI